MARIRWNVNRLEDNTAHWGCAGAVGANPPILAKRSVVLGTCDLPVDPTTPYPDMSQQDLLDLIWVNGVDKDAVETEILTELGV